MDKATLRYRETETLAACPFPADRCGTINMQIRTERGQTKWLAITPDEFRRIEMVLFGAQVEGETK